MGVRGLTDKESTDILKGTARDIYLAVLKSSKPLGIRAIQRRLNLSSPSVAQYHLTRLEHAGLVKREMGNYTVGRVVLNDYIKISRFLIPKFLFRCIFTIGILAVDLFFLTSHVVDLHDFFVLFIIIIFMIIFFHETIIVWVSNRAK